MVYRGSSVSSDTRFIASLCPSVLSSLKSESKSSSLGLSELIMIYFPSFPFKKSGISICNSFNLVMFISRSSSLSSSIFLRCFSLCSKFRNSFLYVISIFCSSFVRVPVDSYFSNIFFASAYSRTFSELRFIRILPLSPLLPLDTSLNLC